eukprot:6189309-Pleurochrysis_carterae.AAC.2
MYLAPPIVAVYFGGALWRRANNPGAVACFVVGYTLGVARLLGEIACKLSGATSAAAQLLFLSNYLYAGFVIFATCVVVLVLVSISTAPPTQVRPVALGSLLDLCIAPHSLLSGFEARPFHLFNCTQLWKDLVKLEI